MSLMTFIKKHGKNSMLLDKASQLKHRPSYLGAIFRPDTFLAAKFYFKLMKLVHFREYRRRVRLKRKFLFDPASIISKVKGFGFIDLGRDPLLMKAIEHSSAVLETEAFKDRIKTAKKPFLINYKIDLLDLRHEPLLRLATCEKLLAPVSEYLGCVPILASIAIWFSPNKEFHEGRSQMFHIDGEDYKQVKCFIPIKPITEKNGPLNIISANESKRIYRRLKRIGKIKRRNKKVSDELVFSHSELKKSTPLLGNVGRVFFVDTNSCYHYGSRPSPEPRYLLHIHYHSPFAVTMPVWGRAYKDLVNIRTETISDIRRELLGLTYLSCAT